MKCNLSLLGSLITTLLSISDCHRLLRFGIATASSRAQDSIIGVVRLLIARLGQEVANHILFRPVMISLCAVCRKLPTTSAVQQSRSHHEVQRHDDCRHSLIRAAPIITAANIRLEYQPFAIA